MEDPFHHDGEPAFLRIRLDPVPFFYAVKLFRTETKNKRVRASAKNN
jgi:hypothetical protein